MPPVRRPPVRLRSYALAFGLIAVFLILAHGPLLRTPVLLGRDGPVRARVARSFSHRRMDSRFDGPERSSARRDGVSGAVLVDFRLFHRWPRGSRCCSSPPAARWSRFCWESNCRAAPPERPPSRRSRCCAFRRCSSRNRCWRNWTCRRCACRSWLCCSFCRTVFAPPPSPAWFWCW